MKRIGFIDHYISEWHANKYPAWLKEAGEAIGEELIVTAVYAEEDTSPVDGRTTAEWCAAYGARAYGSIEELCRDVDFLFILAPDSPEKHLPYANVALPFGKPTYIDKTFAPSLAVAEEIIALSERYGAPMYSTSPLRYATELDGIAPRGFETFSGGPHLSDYIVHPLEMIVKVMGCDATVSAVTRTATGCDATLNYPDGRTAIMHYDPATSGFAIAADGVRVPIASPFFPRLITDVVRFFFDHTPPFDRAETRAVMRLSDEILAKTK